MVVTTILKVIGLYLPHNDDDYMSEYNYVFYTYLYSLRTPKCVQQCAWKNWNMVLYYRHAFLFLKNYAFLTYLRIFDTVVFDDIKMRYHDNTFETKIWLIFLVSFWKRVEHEKNFHVTLVTRSQKKKSHPIKTYFFQYSITEIKYKYSH